MSDYQKTKIYKIINDAVPGKVYYGHTVSRLSDRITKHKKWSNKCTSIELTKEPGAKIILVESFPCNNVDEAKKRERWYIENNECVNKNIPGRTQKEYREQNKDKIAERDKIYYEATKELIAEKSKIYRENNKQVRSEKAKQYYEKNKAKIAEYKKIKITCICGSIYNKNARSSHERTNKHKAFLESTAPSNN